MLPIKKQLDNDDHYDGGNTHEYIVIHDTGNQTDSDEANANYFCTGSRNASAHYFVDDDSITQIVEDNDCSWHVGDGHGVYGITNTNSIGIEQCRVNGVVTSITEANTIELVKFLMAKYNVPLDKVVRHYDASRKNCPASFNLDGKWTRWFEFKNKFLVPSQPASQPTDEIYRVRLSWDDIRSQIEADTDLNNAIECANSHDGYKVFNSKGEIVYPVQTAPATPTPQPVDNLIEGKKYVGDRCLEMQQKLNKIIKAGYLKCDLLAEDSYFGQKSYNALILFQKTFNLTADGLCGDKSFAMMDTVIAEINKPKTTINQNVLLFQKTCNQMGITDSDGHKLSEDGCLGSHTLSTLDNIVVVKKGDRSELVKWIQGIVGCSQDGSFGSITDSQVRQYQSIHGLQVDGKCGKQTLTFMLQHC